MPPRNLPTLDTNSPVLPALNEIRMTLVLGLSLIFAKLISRLSFVIEPSSVALKNQLLIQTKR